MGRDKELHHAFGSACCERLLVVMEYGREGLRRLPLWMVGGHFDDSLERKRELRVHGLLGPQRSVVVEGSNAVLWSDEVRAAFLRDSLDEGGDGLLCGGVVPGWERICLGLGRGQRERCEDKEEARAKQQIATTCCDDVR